MTQPSLRETQRWMKSHIRPKGEPCEAAVALNPQRGTPGEERLAVYASGYLTRTREALEDVYEAVHHVLGAALFGELTRDYAAQTYPLQDYNLNVAGRYLPEFLQRLQSLNPASAPRPKAVGGTVVQQPVGGRDVAPIGAEQSVPRALPVGRHSVGDGVLRAVEGLPFLPDLARLEWCIYQAVCAWERPRLETARLAAVSVDDWAHVRFSFQPCLSVVASAWPILDIWEARKQPRETIDLDLVGRPQQVLVFRDGLQVRCERIDRPQGELLEALLREQSLGAACASLADRDDVAAAHVRHWFARWARQGLLIDYQVVGGSSPGSVLDAGRPISHGGGA